MLANRAPRSVPLDEAAGGDPTLFSFDFEHGTGGGGGGGPGGIGGGGGPEDTGVFGGIATEPKKTKKKFNKNKSM